MTEPTPLPVLLQRRSTDEYAPIPLTTSDRRVRARVAEQVQAGAAALARSESLYAASRVGTAAGLLALNAEFGDEYYRVPPEAALDADAAESALGGDHLLIDVQTHYIAGRADNQSLEQTTLQMYRDARARSGGTASTA